MSLGRPGFCSGGGRQPGVSNPGRRPPVTRVIPVRLIAKQRFACRNPAGWSGPVRTPTSNVRTASGLDAPTHRVAMRIGTGTGALLESTRPLGAGTERAGASIRRSARHRRTPAPGRAAFCSSVPGVRNRAAANISGVLPGPRRDVALARQARCSVSGTQLTWGNFSAGPPRVRSPTVDAG